MMRLFGLSFCLFAAVSMIAAAGCSGGQSGTGAPGNTDNTGSGNPKGNGSNVTPTGPYANITFSIEVVEQNDPTKASGTQGKLLVANDGTVYYAYFKKLAAVSTCDIAKFSLGVPGTVNNYALKIAIRETTNKTWATPIESPLSKTGDTVSTADDNVSMLLGLDGMIDATSQQPVLVFAGGGPGLATCGSSDLIRATRSINGATPSWTFTALATDSGGCCTECASTLLCTSGTNVGAWASIAVDALDKHLVAFSDSHNFWDNDGQTKQGFELWEKSAGAIGAIRPWSGFGAYADLVYANGAPVVGYTGFSGGAGVFVQRRSTTPSTGASTDWASAIKLRAGTIGERISMAVAPLSGKVGVAFHEISNAFGNSVDDLWYCESLDGGVTWKPCENIDKQNLKLGMYPSLVFDKDDRPLIAYGVCGAASCTKGNDGTSMAWRDKGSWFIKEVLFDPGSSSRYYNQIAMDPITKMPIIAFQDLTSGAAMVATGSTK